MIELTEEQTALAQAWYGYGQWSAPYWFIGLEPGGDELDACVQMWLELGRGDLLDIAGGHAAHGKDWFSETAGTQPTWQKLIWLLLAYKGKDATAAATKAYQNAAGARERRNGVDRTVKPARQEQWHPYSA